MVQDARDFVKIKEYVKDKLMTSFYITPKLMDTLINGYNLKCVFGLELDAIKVKYRPKIDLMCTAVYNNVFQGDVIRVDGITLNGTFCKLSKAIYDENVIFGLQEDRCTYCYRDVEKLR